MLQGLPVSTAIKKATVRVTADGQASAFGMLSFSVTTHDSIKGGEPK